MVKLKFFKKNKEKKEVNKKEKAIKRKKKIKNLVGKIAVFAMLFLMIGATIAGILAYSFY